MRIVLDGKEKINRTNHSVIYNREVQQVMADNQYRVEKGCVPADSWGRHVPDSGIRISQQMDDHIIQDSFLQSQTLEKEIVLKWDQSQQLKLVTD